MRESLRATKELLVLDLGEVRRLVTQDGPRLARYVVVVKARGVRACHRMQRNRYHPLLMRHGLPPREAVVYTTPADPLEFEWREGAVWLPGVALYLEGPPEYVSTPYYAWVEDARGEG